MIDDIYVFDDIIEKPYQELIKETLVGDKPPTIDVIEDPFPWYYISDIKYQGKGSSIYNPSPISISFI